MIVFNREVGVDMGSSRTRIFLYNQGVVLDEPTLLAEEDLGGKVSYQIGGAVKQMLGRAPQNIEVHRPIRNGNVEDTHTAEIMLKLFLQKARGISNIFRPEVVLAVPSVINDMEQRALKEVCHKANARNVHAIPSSLAALLGSGVSSEEFRGRMIANIGAGISDIATVSHGGILSSRTVPIGGLEFDKDIAEYIERQHGLIIGLHTAEKIKNEAAHAGHLKKDVVAHVRGMDKATGLPKRVAVSTNRLADAMSGSLEKIITAISEVFSNTPAELTTDITNHGIILSGGVAALPGLDNLISESIGIPVRIAEDANYATILGIGSLIQKNYIDLHRQQLHS